MKTAIFSLIIAISVAILSILQFDRYQKFTLDTQLHLKSLQNEIGKKLENFSHGLNTVEEKARSAVTKVQHPTWKLAEVEYFLSLATVQLQTSDVKNTLGFLNKAQERIKLLADTSLEPLSQAIAADINALQKISLPNLEEIWFKIRHCIEQSMQLKFRGIIGEESKEPLSSKNVEEPHSWKQKFLVGLHDIQGLVRIRHSTKPVEPLLTETEQNLMNTNLRALLEQIRLATLLKNQIIYQQAIEEIKQLLVTYYDEDTNSKNLALTLTDLSNILLSPELPTLTSLPMLNTLR